MSASYARPPADWQVKPLKEIADVIVSNVDKKTIAGETPVRLCNYTDVYKNNDITSAMSFMEASANPAEINSFAIRRGDVIITKDSETPHSESSLRIPPLDRTPKIERR
jgi:type I restriction enzyme, S subunit